MDEVRFFQPHNSPDRENLAQRIGGRSVQDLKSYVEKKMFRCREGLNFYRSMQVSFFGVTRGACTTLMRNLPVTAGP